MDRQAAGSAVPAVLVGVLTGALVAGCGTPDPASSLPTWTGPSATGGSGASPTSAPTATGTGSPGGADSDASPSVSALPSQVLASLASVRPGDPSPVYNRLPMAALVSGPEPWKTLPVLTSGPHKGLPQGSVVAASVPPQNADEKAILDVLGRYLDYVMKAQYEVKVDQKVLAGLALADRPATTQLTKYVAYLRSKKARTVGWMSVNVTQLVQEVGPTVRAGLVNACIDNGSFDALAATGEPIEAVVPAYDSTLGVRKGPQGWRVTSFDSRQRRTRCPVPAA